MTTATAARRQVVESDPNGWLEFDSLGTATYSADVALRLVEDRLVHESYAEPWTEPFDDARSYDYHLYYGASPVDHLHVVRLDDDRVAVPVPRIGNPEATGTDADPAALDYSLSRYEHRVAQVLSADTVDLGRYFERAAVSVREEAF